MRIKIRTIHNQTRRTFENKLTLQLLNAMMLGENYR